MVWEMGPYKYDRKTNNFEMKKNPYSWNNFANLLFVAKMIQVETIIMNRATAMRDAVKLASRI